MKLNLPHELSREELGYSCLHFFFPFQMLWNVVCPWAALSSNIYTVKPLEQARHQLPKAAAPVATQTDPPLEGARPDNAAA